MWARIVNNEVIEVWQNMPTLTAELMADVQEKTLAELQAMGWVVPTPPPEPTPMDNLESDMRRNRMVRAMFKRERTQRGMTKTQLLDELKPYM
jgi:hypothetical protein